ncbi:PAS domain S-box protein [Polyangium sorediatum]|uniref:PAS domain S-box protein n=1 Tax=Polyangium sorediatum TaxID=889274 RepID=A0ABT6P797_9BACT|nr:PAS domain S-box protein [Polyangium sorediatum]MDI1436172.1 PAS domain S-box protein [Polyangium sorediatum]
METQAQGPRIDPREFFEKAPALFCVLDSDNRIYQPNGAWERVTGFSLEALEGMRLEDRLHPEDRDPTRRTSRISVEAQGAIVQETRFRCADDTYKWLEWTMRVVFERGLVFCCARSIEQPRRATVTAARRLEAYLRRAPVAMIETEVGRGVVEWSSGAERIFGYTRTEVLGRRLVDLIVAEPQRETVVDAGFAIREGRIPSGRAVATENITKDGRTVVCEWHNAPLADEEGRVRGVLSIALDRTEIERERARAEESLARFELLMRGSKNGLWDYVPQDPKNPGDPTQPIYVSDGLTRLLGITAEAAPKTLREWTAFVHPEDRERARLFFAEHLASRKEETSFESRLLRVDGSYLWVSSTFQSLWSESGELLRLAAAIVDITERKGAEADLRDKLAVIERQAASIRELSTPILEVQEGVLCLPVVGVVDSGRAAEMMDAALGSVVELQARFLILDLTGVPVLDTGTADRLLAIARAASLVGAKTVITGLRPAVAQTVVTLGVGMGDVKTLRNLKDGLRYCLREASR